MISILVPTLDRSSFVIRLLRYYKNVRFEGNLLIGDSSDGYHADRLESEVKSLSTILRVEYHNCKGMNDSETIGYLSRSSTSRYVAFVGDDDFLIPNGIKDAIAFLENNPDYSIAHGRAALCHLNVSGAYGSIIGCSNYRLGALEEDKASNRLISHLKRYFVTLFSVHRAHEHAACYENISNVSDKSFTELLPSCLPVLQGKVKQIESLYLIRQVHDARYLLPTSFDWTLNPNWLPSYRLFRDCLAEQLAFYDNLALSEARTVVEAAFANYMLAVINSPSNEMSVKWRSIYEGSSVAKRKLLVEIGKQIPGSKRLWHRLKGYASPHGPELSLSELENMRSRYYADFLPINQMIQVHSDELGH